MYLIDENDSKRQIIDIDVNKDGIDRNEIYLSIGDEKGKGIGIYLNRKQLEKLKMKIESILG